MRLQTCSFYLRRLYSTAKPIKPKMCIVGAGPAGFYAAQYLLKRLQNCVIDIYERLPVPFGLVRFGVAPDHPEVKNVISTFSKTAENPGVNFIGNVNLGSDVSLDLLKKCYHIVLLTYGADKNKHLGIPGEDNPKVIPARKIVGWYNGLPWDSDLNIDLSGETVTIFGQGNVAIDVARILLSPVDKLSKTDITHFALDALSQSKVRRVHLVGRRGPLQAAFTIKELREMLKLPGCGTIWRENDFSGVANHLPNLNRPKKRITELMLKSLGEKTLENGKIFSPIFYRSPLEIVGKNDVKEVILGVNTLKGDNILNQSAAPTEETETISTDLVIPSIGYKSIQPDPDIPFDNNRGLIKNNRGRIDRGLYAAGWAATGPVGVILTTMNNAFAIADTILQDAERENLIDVEKPGYEAVKEVLIKKNVQTVSWDGWKKIDEYEKQRGEKVGKPREKLTSIEEMLKIAHS